MQQIIRILSEGAAQAWQQLTANKLRSFLSLLGVTIGIFCIIGVESSVDSLVANIRGSMSKLGNDVIYLDKFSWAEDPGQNYWKWMRRPDFTYSEFEFLENQLDNAGQIGFYQVIGAKTVKWQKSSVQNAFFIGMTYDCRDLFHLEFQEGGRYFTQGEYHRAADVCLVGSNIAEGLFGENIDPVDRIIAVGGRKLRVTGVLQKSGGNNLIDPFNFENCVLIGYNLARRSFNLRAESNPFDRTSIMVKAAEGVSVENMKDEITGELRAIRRLRPGEDANFSLNTLTVLSKVFDSVFGVLNIAGRSIGIFALIVGIFSVANIMFVSVRERTNIIGIKMALGAKRWFILLEILFEAVVLCIVGGLFGLLFVWLATVGISAAIDFKIFLSIENVLVGITASVIVGVLSGLIPAIQASGLDPVEAIRK